MLLEINGGNATWLNDYSVLLKVYPVSIKACRLKLYIAIFSERTVSYVTKSQNLNRGW